jgi:hypothetical protein
MPTPTATTPLPPAPTPTEIPPVEPTVGPFTPPTATAIPVPPLSLDVGAGKTAAGEPLTVNIAINKSISSSSPFKIYLVAFTRIGLYSFTYGGGRFKPERGFKPALAAPIRTLPLISLPPLLNQFRIPVALSGSTIEFIAAVIPTDAPITSKSQAQSVALSWDNPTVAVK